MTPGDPRGSGAVRYDRLAPAVPDARFISYASAHLG